MEGRSRSDSECGTKGRVSFERNGSDRESEAGGRDGGIKTAGGLSCSTGVNRSGGDGALPTVGMNIVLF